MKVIQSTCNYCSLACNLNFHVEDNTIKIVEPTPGYPVNDGFCCIKGLNLDKQNTEFRNPTLPQLRDNDGKMKEISWDEAFKAFAEKVKAIQDKNGKESVAFISTGQLATEEMALAGHIGRTFLGMNGDGNTRLCMATSVVAHKQSFGFDAPPYTMNDAELSDTIILIGANPIVCHPILWGRMRKNKDAIKIAIDPRRSETASNCDLWYDIKPKADLYLLYTLANVLIEKGWINQEYIDNYTEGFDDFKEFVKKFKLDDVEKTSGISKERVLKLAEIIHNGKKVSFWWTMGVNQTYQAVRTAQAIINLALMTGNIGRPGTGANSITGQSNAMGSRLYSNTTGFYGGGEYNDPARRKRIAEVLEVDEEMLPTKPTIPYDKIIDQCISGEIKGLWIMCTNPASSWINNTKFLEAAKKLEFLVLQDIYGDTDTAELCHLLLPSQSGLKKEGVYINTERRMSAILPVLEKKENELTDFDILLGIGEALGMGKLLDKWRTPKIAFETLRECSKGMPCDITGVEYDMLRYSKGIQWPFRKGEKLEENQRRLYEDNKFYTPSKKAKFMFEEVAARPIEISEEFPYALNTGRGTVGQWHTQTRTREIPAVEAITISDAYINVNPELAEELGIIENEKIRVVSANGKSAEFIAKLSRTVKRNDLYAPMHYDHANKLLPSIFDTYSREPSYKYVPVRIEKIS
ncbi:MAG: molybdopterin oxidoreductase family protein [Clostridium sp.]|uniref:molybdopterin oxidoreductase family protein n=1 Tax=Clostridium sp. TaxID=1506 RepID=UPI003075A736